LSGIKFIRKGETYEGEGRGKKPSAKLVGEMGKAGTQSSNPERTSKTFEQKKYAHLRKDGARGPGLKQKQCWGLSYTIKRKKSVVPQLKGGGTRLQPPKGARVRECKPFKGPKEVIDNYGDERETAILTRKVGKMIE